MRLPEPVVKTGSTLSDTSSGQTMLQWYMREHHHCQAMTQPGVQVIRTGRYLDGGGATIPQLLLAADQADLQVGCCLTRRGLGSLQVWAARVVRWHVLLNSTHAA